MLAGPEILARLRSLPAARYPCSLGTSRNPYASRARPINNGINSDQIHRFLVLKPAQKCHHPEADCRRDQTAQLHAFETVPYQVSLPLAQQFQRAFGPFSRVLRDLLQRFTVVVCFSFVAARIGPCRDGQERKQGNTSDYRYRNATTRTTSSSISNAIGQLLECSCEICPLSFGMTSSLPWRLHIFCVFWGRSRRK